MVNSEKKENIDITIAFTVSNFILCLIITWGKGVFAAFW